MDDGSGGTDVGKFKATVTIPASPAALQWTNLSTIAAAGIDRSQDLTITWTGGDPTSEYAVLAGATLLPGIESKIQLAAAFACTANFSAGQLTVPAAVLSALPASNTSDPTSGILLFGRAPLLNDNLKFAAPGVDIAYLTNAVFNGTLVVFR